MLSHTPSRNGFGSYPAIGYRGDIGHLLRQPRSYCPGKTIPNITHVGSTSMFSITSTFVRNCVEDGSTKLQYSPTEKMVADGLTKAPGLERHRKMGKASLWKNEGSDGIAELV
jgi:hypothetical protein